jgi:hypothetical protein
LPDGTTTVGAFPLTPAGETAAAGIGAIDDPDAPAPDVVVVVDEPDAAVVVVVDVCAA